KEIRKSLEELLMEEIQKAIVSQGRNPKKAAKEIKKSAALIAKRLADKESLSKSGAEKKGSDPAPRVQSVKSFDVPSLPAPELPVIPDPPTAPARRGRKPAATATAEAEAVPVRPVRKRAPRVKPQQEEPQDTKE